MCGLTVATLRADDDVPANDVPANDETTTDDAAPERKAPAPAPKRTYNTPLLIRFEGPITQMRTQYFFRSLEKAKQANADLLVVEFHSPGGLLEESLEIGNALKDVDWARTVAFIPANSQALSGAAIASLGCDELVMGDNAAFGDAGVIVRRLTETVFRHAPEKIRTDVARKVRDLAAAKGRSPALAEAMVDMDLQVYRVRDRESGEIAFLSEAEIAAEEQPDRWEKVQLVLESQPGKFLEINGRRAVELRMAQGNAENRDQLAERFELAVDFQVIEPNWVDTTVYVLNLPFITGLLLLVGFVALYFELSAPGLSIGGLTSGLCFALFFWSRFLGGTAGWLEVILFIAGLVFLGVELFVLPGFGVAGVSGVALLLSALVLASQTFVIPETTQDLRDMSGSTLIVVGSIAAFFVGALVITKVTGKIPILSNFALEPPSFEDDPEKGEGKVVVVPEEDLVQVGDWGEVEAALRPSGKAKFGDNYFDVVSEGMFVEAGKQVRVVKREGRRIVVREIT